MQLPVMAWEWDFLPVLTWEWDFITNVGMGMRLSPYWYGNEITSSSMRIIFSGMGMRLSPYWHGNEITSSNMRIIFSGMGMRLSPVQAWEWDLPIVVGEWNYTTTSLIKTTARVHNQVQA